MALFVTLEGLEGSGKSTQARLLGEYLESKGERVLVTREPGGTRIGEQIREVIHSLRNQEMAPETEFLLYNAARAQIVVQVIRPALAQGISVVCDRYADSTVAYQGYGRQLDLKVVRDVIRFATGGLVPDVTIFLDIGIDEGMARRKNGHALGEELNRMDSQTREFYERVRAGYEALIRAEPERWVRVNAGQSVYHVQAELRAKLENLLASRRLQVG